MTEEIGPDKLYLHYLLYLRTVRGRTATTMYDIVSDLLHQAWCRRTMSAYGCERWNGKNPEVGQSEVSALVVQDLLGGSILLAYVPGHGPHFWNEIPNGEGVHVFDATRSQFPQGTAVPPGRHVTRDVVLRSGAEFVGEQTPERYTVLVRRMADIMSAAR